MPNLYSLLMIFSLISCTQLVHKKTISESYLEELSLGTIQKNDVIIKIGSPLATVQAKDREVLIYRVNSESCVAGLNPLEAVGNFFTWGFYYYFNKKLCENQYSTSSLVFKNNLLVSSFSGLSDQNFFQKPDGYLGIAIKCKGGTASCLQRASVICGKNGYEIIEKKVVGSESNSVSSGQAFGNGNQQTTTSYNPFTKQLTSVGVGVETANSYSSTDTSTNVIEEMLFSCKNN